jgi:hypothetical protein
LKTIAIYTHTDPTKKELSTYNTLLRTSPSTEPLTLFLLSREGGWIDTVIAFPSFSRHWSAEHIRLPGDRIFLVIGITRFTLFLPSISDESVLRPAISSIAEHFPQVTDLRLVVSDRDIHKVRPTILEHFNWIDTELVQDPDVVSSILSPLRELRILCIDYQELDDAAPSVYQADAQGIARRWAAKCPNLEHVMFPDQETIVSIAA